MCLTGSIDPQISLVQSQTPQTISQVEWKLWFGDMFDGNLSDRSANHHILRTRRRD